VLSTLIDRIGRERNVVAIDGSLFANHPHIHELMMGVISELSPGKSFNIINVKDGSGMGAGLAAAILSHL
jgi:hexokinase